MDNKLNTPAAQHAGLTTLLTASGARRWVRCHDGSGEAFAAYDVEIADSVVAELTLKIHALEASARSAAASEPKRTDAFDTTQLNLAAYRWPDGPSKFYYQDVAAPVGASALQTAERLYTADSTGNSTPWSTRAEPNTITLNYSFASALLGAMFNGPTFNPAAFEQIKQAFAAVMRSDKGRSA